MNFIGNFFKKRVPVKGKTQLYYEAHKGEILGHGVICGYNELKKMLIVETENGLWGKDHLHPYDEIFSDKNEFLYVPIP